MAHTVSDDCIKCGTCIPNCPVEAITEGSNKVEVNKDVCIDCGACEADCPTGAIKAE